jgi:hypothetical protein
MVSLPSDDGPQADYSVVMSSLGKSFGHHWQLKRPWYPGYVDVLIAYTVPFQGLNGPFKQPPGHELVEAGHYNSHPKALTIQLYLHLSGHLLFS